MAGHDELPPRHGRRGGRSRGSSGEEDAAVDDDLGLIAFGLVLRARGWGIDFVGPDTPVESLEEAARRTEPSVVVVSAVRSEPLEQLTALATRHRVAIAGAGAASAGVQGVERLTTDPVTAAERLTT